MSLLFQYLVAGTSFFDDGAGGSGGWCVAWPGGLRGRSLAKMNGVQTRPEHSPSIIYVLVGVVHTVQFIESISPWDRHPKTNILPSEFL